MAFVVVYDACVLYPAHIRDFLLRLATTDLFQAKWSEGILDETFEAIVARHPEHASRLARTRRLMGDAVRDGLVEGYEPLIDSLELPDPDDRHVLAVAIRCQAQVIVTFNSRDFPAHRLEPYGVEAQTPDEFVQNLLDLAPETVVDVFCRWLSGLRHPSRPAEVLALLQRDGMRKTAGLLRSRLP